MSAANDAEWERVYNDLVENKLVLSNLLGRFQAMVSTIVASNNSSTASGAAKARFSHLLVRQTSTLRLVSIHEHLSQ